MYMGVKAVVPQENYKLCSHLKKRINELLRKYQIPDMYSGKSSFSGHG
jgi:hypothetical protein